MKLFHFTLLSGRDAFSRLLLLALVSGSCCLSSCEDDMDRPLPAPHVSFTSEISSSWTPSTRSAVGTDAPQGTVTALEGGSTPLYLHTLYTDSIASPLSDSRPDTTILTRATPIKNENMYDSFGVSAYSYTDSWSESKTPNYFYNATASKSGSDYALSSTYYWPGVSYKMKFFAYAPKDNGQYVLSGSTHSGSPTISVTIPNDVNGQQDLLVAKTDELGGNTNTAVPLTFNHALTAIKFACGDDMQGGTVKSVSLKNVYSKGTYNMGTQSWSSVDTPATFSQALNKPTTGTTGEALTTDVQTFMMVPQTLPDNAQLEIVFTDNSSIDHTLTADIKNTLWPVGKTVTYKISSSSINWTYTLTVSQPADFSFTGGTQQYSVISYKINGKGDKVAIPWTTQYSENNGNSWSSTKPSWLTNFTISGNGGETPQSYNATVSAQAGTDNSPHTAALQNAPIKGVTRVYDLSNSTGGVGWQNSANCYVINAPGFYCLPLVYGNGIKNGNSNPSAFTSSATGSNILHKFINHKGNEISDPQIFTQSGFQIGRVGVVWQDAPGLVSDIKLSGSKQYLHFTVEQSTIRQGNAVLAVYDTNNEIAWSWHIWVTDEDINNTIEVTNQLGYKYKFMPVNLGWCDANTTTYAERSCKVKFTAGGESQTITIKQASNSITVRGNHPYYQWGRKDPFQPSNGINLITKPWYDNAGTVSTTNPAVENLSTGTACLKNYILKPNVIQKQYQGDNLYHNLWSVNNDVTTANDNPVIKTIYDPCPVGFKLPASNAFTGFTTTGNNTNTLSEINGIWDSSLKGWNFYTNSTKTQTIFFSASGFREYSKGELISVRGYGCYWSAVPVNPAGGRSLGFNASSANPLGNYYRAYGFGVRSSQE